MKVFDFVVIFPHRAERAIKEARLPERTFVHPVLVDGYHGTLLNGLDGERNRHRISRRANRVPVIGKRHLGRQEEGLQDASPVESLCQQREIGFG